MNALEAALEETLRAPQLVIQSRSDAVAELNCRYLSAAVTQKQVLPKPEADGGPLTQKGCYPIDPQI